MLQPLLRAKSFSEFLNDAESPGQFRKCRVVVTRRARWCDRALHRSQIAVLGAGSNVIAFEWSRRGQDNVSAPRGGGPPWLVHDDRFRTLPCPDEAIQILMVMKRIATRPVNQPDVGIGEIFAVVLKRLA